jgi:hypothetical protein
MKNIIKTLTSSLVSAGIVVMGAGAFQTAYALDCAGADAGSSGCEAKKGVNQIGGTGAGNTAADFTGLITNIINILLFVIGAVAVIMIIIGGLRYVTSGGDTASTKAARDTILYAVIGLVIAIMAYAIVNFVLASL